MLFRFLTVIVFAVTLGACVTPPTGKYPEFKDAPKIAALSTTVSTLTETPAEDHLIPNSQVFVTGRGATGGYLSLLGTAIDRARNAAAVEQAASALTIKFQQNPLRTRASLQSGRSKVEVNRAK